MKELQRMISLANDTNLKHDKQKLEIITKYIGKTIEMELVLTTVSGGRRNVVDKIKFRDDEYTFEEALEILEKVL